MRRSLASLSVLVLAAALSVGFVDPSTATRGVLEACSDHPAPVEETVESQADGIDIDITVFRPCAATEPGRSPRSRSSAIAQAPVILHSHGWGGTKTSSGFTRELDAGFGVVSITQRGHGDSGGQAHVQDPELEAQDIKSVIDHVAAKDWVLLDTDENGERIAGDPVLFAIGGSYGGGYQTITALTEIRESGSTRFNALAPEITWFDLPQSLAPQDVSRSLWNTLLYGAGVARVDMADFIHEAFAWGSTTGQWPDGTVLGEDDPTGEVPDIDSIFHAHSPVAFSEEDLRLDIPTIWRQGITDTLFPLNEAWHNFHEVLTDDARGSSLLLGYNGGHALPTAYPSVRADEPLGGVDACSFDGFGELRLDFFQAVVDGEDPAAALMAAHDGLARYNLTTDDSESCVRYDAPPAPRPHPAGQDVDIVVEQIEDGWMTTTGAGAATHTELEGVEGPATIAGVPVLTGEVAALGIDQRAFFGLSRGTSVADAELIQANLAPLRVLTPTTDIAEPFEIELPGIAVELQEGERLFLTVTPVSEQFYGHGSKRTPGWMGFTDLEVQLPVLD